MNTSIIKYQTEVGTQIELSPEIIKSYLVSGDPSKVTDQEVMLFLNLCKYQKLNPFLREAYLIKFGNAPATIVTGKEVFTKRAQRNADFEGMEAGIIIDKENGLEYRNGTVFTSKEQLIGGWAKVYRKNLKVPFESTASLQEYVKYKSDGSIQSTWKTMPATMIRKVALVQALREAFPEDFQGLYSQEEMPVDNSLLSSVPVEPNKKLDKENLITTAQAKRIFTIADSKEFIVRETIDKYGYVSTKEIQTKDYDNIIKDIEIRLVEFEQNIIDEQENTEE